MTFDVFDKHDKMRRFYCVIQFTIIILRRDQRTSAQAYGDTELRGAPCTCLYTTTEYK